MMDQKTFDKHTTEKLCTRILERHRDTVQVKKRHLAVANLGRIIDATLLLSNKRSFHDMSLRDLASKSGISIGGLYAYIGSKDTLLDMILGEVHATVNEVLASADENIKADPVTYLRWLIETHIRLTEAMQSWFVFAFMEAKSFPKAARRFATESEISTELFFVTALKKGLSQNIFEIEDVDLTASLIKPLLQDWYVKRAKYRARGTTLEQYIQAVTIFVDRAMLRS